MTKKTDKNIKIDKADYSVEGNKITIESDELANCIQNEGLELPLDEEAGVVASLGSCCLQC